MAKQVVESRYVAKTKGPYVQGVTVSSGKLVFTSGLLARDREGTMVGIGNIRKQTQQCLENVGHVLEAAGGSMRDLVKVTVFLRDLKDYVGMNEVRREMLEGIPLASSTVEAGLNDSNALIEIEAVAVVSRRRSVGRKRRKVQGSRR